MISETRKQATECLDISLILTVFSDYLFFTPSDLLFYNYILKRPVLSNQDFVPFIFLTLS